MEYLTAWDIQWDKAKLLVGIDVLKGLIRWCGDGIVMVTNNLVHLKSDKYLIDCILWARSLAYFIFGSHNAINFQNVKYNYLNAGFRRSRNFFQSFYFFCFLYHGHFLLSVILKTSTLCVCAADLLIFIRPWPRSHELKNFCRKHRCTKIK